MTNTEQLNFMAFVNGIFSLIYSIYLSIYVWLCWVFVAARGLCLVKMRSGYSLVMMLGLPIAVISLVVEQRL